MSGNRERVIEAATELFHQKGFPGTSVEDLLVATGVSRSNFYYHFTGKEAVAVEVVRYWIQVYEAELVGPALGTVEDAHPATRGADQSPTTMTDRILALFDLAGDSQDPETGPLGCPLGQLACELSESSPHVRSLLAAYFSSLRDRIQRWMEGLDLPGAGDTPDVPARMATLVVAVLEGGFLMGRLHQDPAWVRTAGHQLGELLREVMHSP
jgi:TetR/AcrR family transcriptional regulator, transcriptional repressor for nem operon